MTNNKNDLVISLGGSLIYTEEGLSNDFLPVFKDFILEELKYRSKIFIVCGGGKIARNYVQTSRNMANISDEEADWLGIYATRLNAYFMKTLFPSEYTFSELLFSPDQDIDKSKQIFLAGGYKPGRSTDCMSVELATLHNIDLVINLSNIQYLYNQDPKKYKDAKQITHINWKDYRKMIDSKWIPGSNLPFDPTASKLAQDNQVKMFLTKPKPLSNLTNYCRDNSADSGTLIE